MSVTKTLAAAALALSVTTSGAYALEEARPANDNTGLLFGALFLAAVGLLIGTGGGGTTTTSTKDGPALDLDLPDPGTQTIKDF